jgi:hypothetical protein
MNAINLQSRNRHTLEGRCPFVARTCIDMQ